MKAKPTKRKRIAIAQAGGPTAVINCSLLGFLKCAATWPEPPDVFGVAEGMAGLVEGRLYPLQERQPLDWLRVQPGAALGAGRKMLTDDDFAAAVDQLRRRDIHLLALTGGNGTMWACRQLAFKARELGYELQVVGIPKTVDNDLMGTDHTPGFPSAARFVAHAVRDLAADLASMRNFEQVRVVETMGRNVGWLTAASAYYKNDEDDAPHLLYLPETTFDLEAAVASVEAVYRRLGYCLMVVSEGLKDRYGRPISAQGISGGRVKGKGQQALGGIGSVVVEILSKELGLACRYENLGILQRCDSLSASPEDRNEAEIVGARAAELLLRGQGGVMITIERAASTSEYRWTTGSVPLERVAGMERALDAEFLDASGGVSDLYREWLRPLIGQSPPYRQLLPDRRAPMPGNGPGGSQTQEETLWNRR
jgi:6-phosphofructokinase 1